MVQIVVIFLLGVLVVLAAWMPWVAERRLERIRRG
jgi:hypothetical protein